MISNERRVKAGDKHVLVRLKLLMGLEEVVDEGGAGRGLGGLGDKLGSVDWVGCEVVDGHGGGGGGEERGFAGGSKGGL